SDPVINGAMASAAIPGVFQARLITTASRALTYVDGGVREALPGQAAVELGAQLLFLVSALPSAAGNFSLPNQWSIPSLGTRGIDLVLNEITVEEKNPRAGFCDDRQRMLVEPAITVQGTTQIDPGLIRINFAYGYFLAFNADQLRRGNI